MAYTFLSQRIDGDEGTTGCPEKPEQPEINVSANSQPFSEKLLLRAVWTRILTQPAAQDGKNIVSMFPREGQSPGDPVILLKTSPTTRCRGVLSHEYGMIPPGRLPAVFARMRGSQTLSEDLIGLPQNVVESPAMEVGQFPPFQPKLPTEGRTLQFQEQAIQLVSRLLDATRSISGGHVTGDHQRCREARSGLL